MLIVIIPYRLGTNDKEKNLYKFSTENLFLKYV
jgi:hypothetical protein